jgi:hypothetical protein
MAALLATSRDESPDTDVDLDDPMDADAPNPSGMLTFEDLNRNHREEMTFAIRALPSDLEPEQPRSRNTGGKIREADFLEEVLQTTPTEQHERMRREFRTKGYTRFP